MTQLTYVPTPIGNLKDITIRALEVLRIADVVAAEDTRRTRKLLSHYEISTPVVRLDQHTISTRARRILEDHELKMRDVGLPLRAAITGTKQSPSIVDIMAVLGETETLARLRVACK